MLPNPNIVYIENPSEEHHGVIIAGIDAYAASRGLKGTGGFFYAIYDENNNIIAAISGFDNFGPTEIGGLWVDEQFRGLGYGKALVDKAEQWAKQKGCKALTVFTLKNWPACEWYQKIGFSIQFERPNHNNQTAGCYLIKSIS